MRGVSLLDGGFIGLEEVWLGEKVTKIFCFSILFSISVAGILYLPDKIKLIWEKNDGKSNNNEVTNKKNDSKINVQDYNNNMIYIWQCIQNQSEPSSQIFLEKSRTILSQINNS